MSNSKGYVPQSRRDVIKKLSALSAAAMAPGAAISPAVANARWNPELRNKPDDLFVIDGVAHAFNHDVSNFRNPNTIYQTASYGYDFHLRITPEKYRLSPEQYLHDWMPEEFMELMFLESNTDMVCMHSVPLFTYYKDGLVSNSKGAYLKRNYPERVFWYAGIDIFDEPEAIYRTLDWVAAHGADGIKLYPSRINWDNNQREWWFMDDVERVFPVFEYAVSKGIKHIACHKIAGHVDSVDAPNYMGVEDFTRAAETFPDVWFHIVHAGLGLLDETVEIMNRHPNTTAVLEGPMFWPKIDKQAFEHVMKQMVGRTDQDRILYSSGASSAHPHFLIDAFLDWHPEGEVGFDVNDAFKAKVLGLNFAKIHGLDVQEQRKVIANDKFAQIVQKDGFREPYAKQRAFPDNLSEEEIRNFIRPVPFDTEASDDASLTSALGNG